jgi:hypothetical protein
MSSVLKIEVRRDSVEKSHMFSLRFSAAMTIHVALYESLNFPIPLCSSMSVIL